MKRRGCNLCQERSSDGQQSSQVTPPPPTTTTRIDNKIQQYQFQHDIIDDSSFIRRSSSSSSSSHREILTQIWNTYKTFVKKYQIQLELADDAVSRILFWVRGPGGTTDENEDKNSLNSISISDAWREVCYGILSLQRLLMHLATIEDYYTNEDEALSCSYGTSIQTRDKPQIPATSVRICLTIIQSIIPSVLAISQASSVSSVSTLSQVKRKSTARLVLEQIKFVLRMYLLVNYWKQQLQQQTPTNTIDGKNDTTNNNRLVGILMDGGLYQAYQPTSSVGMAWDEAFAIQRRQNYVGKRTGRKLLGISRNGVYNSSVSSSDTNNVKFVLVGDLLNTLRPLIWALFESRYPKAGFDEMHEGSAFSLSTWSPDSRKLLKGWFLCLGMDLLSIRLLQRSNTNSLRPNAFTEEELRRRKMRLLLYALRNPVFSQSTVPIIDGFSRRVLQKIPLLGSLLETFVWDWVLYYQHPYIAEER